MLGEQEHCRAMLDSLVYPYYASDGSDFVQLVRAPLPITYVVLTYM